VCVCGAIIPVGSDDLVHCGGGHMVPSSCLNRDQRDGNSRSQGFGNTELGTETSEFGTEALELEAESHELWTVNSGFRTGTPRIQD
jgi:hypothetical protein